MVWQEDHTNHILKPVVLASSNEQRAMTIARLTFPFYPKGSCAHEGMLGWKCVFVCQEHHRKADCVTNPSMFGVHTSMTDLTSTQALAVIFQKHTQPLPLTRQSFIGFITLTMSYLCNSSHNKQKVNKDMDVTTRHIKYTVCTQRDTSVTLLYNTRMVMFHKRLYTVI